MSPVDLTALLRFGRRGKRNRFLRHVRTVPLPAASAKNWNGCRNSGSSRRSSVRVVRHRYATRLAGPDCPCAREYEEFRSRPRGLAGRCRRGTRAYRRGTRHRQERLSACHARILRITLPRSVRVVRHLHATSILPPLDVKQLGKFGIEFFLHRNGDPLPFVLYIYDLYCLINSSGASTKVDLGRKTRTRHACEVRLSQ
jgi:hypothetical protein